VEISPNVQLLEEDAALAEPETTRDQDEQSAGELRERALMWDKAIRDRDEASARRVLAPNFALELVQPMRSIAARDVWLEVLADYVVHEWEVEEQVVDLDGDCAAILQRVRMQATVMGEDRSGLFVMTDLWRRIGGEWMVWRRHSTPLEAGRLPSRATG